MMLTAADHSASFARTFPKRMKRAPLGVKPRPLPLLAQSAAETPGVTFAFVNQGDDGATIQTYLGEQGIVLPDAYLDPTWRTSTHYQALGLPTTLFVDADGRLAKNHVGEISPEQLNDALASLSH